MSYSSPALRDIPSTVSSEDRQRLQLVAALSLQSRVVLYEEMLERYQHAPDSHPFFLVRLADSFTAFQSKPIAVDIYHKAQSVLSKMGIADSVLDDTVHSLTAQVENEINQSLISSQQIRYFRKWKPTKDFKFPTYLPHAPLGAQEVLDEWRKFTSDGPGSAFSASYLKKLAIESNHIESVFRLTEASSQDLIHQGISEGTVICLPESALHDDAKIKDILHDMLAACELLRVLVDNSDGLDKDAICRIHARFMRTCRFSNTYCVPSGKTRTETRKNVIVAGVYTVQTCPFQKVDMEVEYICKMAKQWIKSWRNPFATASWIHLILAVCHPFEGGNGRLLRLLASIPLMRRGYPPISISHKHRAEYYAAITKAYEGDHTHLVQCILQGMQETLDSVKSS